MVSGCSKGGSDECLASCLILLPCSRQPTCLNVRKHYSWERRKTSCVVRMKKQTNILTKEIKIFETQKRHGQKVAKKMRSRFCPCKVGGGQNPEKLSRRRPGAKHCSSLCSQSEGGEFCGDQAGTKNPTKSYPRALVMFATYPWPSLCEQSELQCWRRNRRLCGSTQISAARMLPPTFYISSFCTPMFVSERGSRHERIWE